MSFPVLVLSALLLAAADASSGGETPTRTYDVSGELLINIYNSPVFLAERMEKKKIGLPFSVGPVGNYTGVRVMLADGSRYLIHKGHNYGILTQTVVVDASHMSSSWKVIATHNFQGSKTVAEIVIDGCSEYSLSSDNCHDASKRINED